ncbi:hypothetical protein J2Z69_003322 [Paenibacillus shirakamiensis]|uniref:Uncharacterized protein n=1 Tax=Paenibacillus shirakamiensis TaxID=1265935 RepID=A0ABS4JKL4_9BACL|nr:hypothetical protein [Paenibacillus shirakamiensis]MBP2002250.1 hypothetical protein [Paenibacillus shirakamiensis]
MKKITLIVLSLFCLSLIVTLFLNNNLANASIEKQVDTKLALIKGKINKEVELKTELAMSSNPYDYIKDNKDFESIVALGNNALPILQEKIEKSPNDGLQEYILAIAIEKISKTDLKKNSSTEWNSAKSFEKNWKQYLKAIPLKVNEISSSSKEINEKINGLIELGTPAIPFIAEEIVKGKEDIFPALKELIKDDGELKVARDVSITKELFSQKNSIFEGLRSYVNEQ